MRHRILLSSLCVMGLVGVVAAQSAPRDESPFGDPDEGIKPSVVPSESDPAPIASEDRPAPDEPAVVRPSHSSTELAQPVGDDETALRQQYLKLVTEKAELMDRMELRESIGQMERDIDELKATAELADARRQLLDLIDKYPKTQAAQAAQRMLQIDNPVPDDAEPRIYRESDRSQFGPPALPDNTAIDAY